MKATAEFTGTKVKVFDRTRDEVSEHSITGYLAFDPDSIHRILTLIGAEVTDECEDIRIRTVEDLADYIFDKVNNDLNSEELGHLYGREVAVPFSIGGRVHTWYLLVFLYKIFITNHEDTPLYLIDYVDIHYHEYDPDEESGYYYVVINRTDEPEQEKERKARLAGRVEQALAERE
jgi:hypothetical protein